MTRAISERSAGRIRARFTDQPDEILEDLRAQIRSGDVVLILSNGAFGGIYKKIREAF